jgi:tetratricopeptide (TPR) repeat protein
MFKDTQLAFTLTRLELPNLLGLLAYLAEQGEAETTLDVATRVEQMLAHLDHPRLLKRVVEIREGASQELGEGLKDAHFVARLMEIERLLQAGQVQQALQAAQGLLAASQEPGSQVSDYNQALAFSLLGSVLFKGGAAGEALGHFQEAQRRFERLGERSARMVSVVISRQGDCLRDLRRLKEAAEAYEQAIKRFETLQDDRWTAVSKSNLATVWMLQGRYAEALAAYEKARETFAELGEPNVVAGMWHQMGVTHEEAGNYEAAEGAYREALALRVKHRYRTDEAATLSQLGLLYDKMGRLEEAVTFHRQAVDIGVLMHDTFKEGLRRNNLAVTLTRLGRHNEARGEIGRAIECRQPYGHAAELWKTWMILHDLERAAGDPAAAERAKGEARRLFLAYRQEGGGEPQRRRAVVRGGWRGILVGQVRVLKR